MLKPIPDIEDVFNMVTQEERQKSIKPTSKLDQVVFQNFGPTAESYSGIYDNSVFAAAHHNNFCPKQRPLRIYCGHLGHRVQKCFKIHGYPPGRKFSQNSSNIGYGQTKGYSQNGIVPRGYNNFNPRPSFRPQNQFHPPEQQQFTQMNTVANVTSSGNSPLYMPPPATNAVNIDLS